MVVNLKISDIPSLVVTSKTGCFNTFYPNFIRGKIFHIYEILTLIFKEFCDDLRRNLRRSITYALVLPLPISRASHCMTIWPANILFVPNLKP